ncbi:MAG: helix-turn-helix domain-containing protein [Clostridia bacterium]|nr:helix-turn-helix domain-containing protein [Clostridia bacterium]MDE7329295.1 helix-turn-helix domain-containing protein [Clostridia bacterium]
MNQSKIGQFITKKRKEKNLTQEQLAERLNVSNKTVSKWECGKCMPDYSLVEPLCKELNVSIAELFDGKESEESSASIENEQVIKLIKDMEQLKKDKDISKLYLSGLILAVIGIVLCLLSKIFGGSGFQDFISGFFIGVAIALFFISVFIVVFATANVIKKNKNCKS